MRRDSFRKPMSTSDDSSTRKNSLLPHEQSSKSQDPDFMRQLTIDTLVQQGQELVWKRQLKDAAKVLERSLNILRGIEVLQMPVKEGSRNSIISQAEEEKEPGRIDSGPTIQTLCLVYTRANEWQKVRELAELALSDDTDTPLHIFGQDVLLDVKLRRAVALTNLAGPTHTEPHRLPILDLLDKAEKDLMDVEKSRPKDDAVRRGLQHVAFLKKQSLLAIPTTGEPLTGLARLRAMDA